MEMDLLETLLAEVQSKNKLYSQPGRIVGARLQQFGQTHFMGLDYEFAQPGITAGIVITAALDGDYRHVQSYALPGTHLDANLERAGRLAGNGYCPECSSKRLPQESIIDGQFQLACRECGFKEVVE